MDNPSPDQPPPHPSPFSKETVPPPLPNDPSANALPLVAAAGDAGSPPSPRVPGYQILRELGRGGMGVVYEARQEDLNRIVALKMILKGEHASPQDLARFRAEALAIAKLQHPNIVQVYAVSSHDGLPFFVLEYCAGGTLSDRLVPRKGIDLKEAAELVARLAHAVHAAHQAGIIHRDLKPGNILFTKDGTPKVTDFGLAKQLDSPLTQTLSGMIMGTPSYMSPEQAAGQPRAVGAGTDLFALGVILYEALTGQRPFDAATTWETLQWVCTRDPLPPRALRHEVPSALEAIVLKCLEKDPKKRYATALDLADDLERWRQGEPVRASWQRARHRLGTQLRRHRRKVALAVGVPCLLLAWLGLSDAGYRLPGAGAVRQWLDRREASLFRPAPSDEKLRIAAADQRGLFRQRLVNLVTANDGWFPASPSVPKPDPWTQMQCAAALFSCRNLDRAAREACLHRLEDMFEPNHEIGPFIPNYGWPTLDDGNISAEPCAWALLAIVKAVTVPGLVDGPDRVKLLKRLNQVQTALDHYRCEEKAPGQPNGGWNLFADQVDPSQGNIYITLVVCRGLLELCRADLPWRDSYELRDRLLHQTIAWLLDRFDGRGWSILSTVDQYNDGFSLHIFTTLLDAEAGGYVTLPDAVLKAIPPALSECITRPADHQSPVALFNVPIRKGSDKAVQTPIRRARTVWYAWSVSCAARWLRRCERVGAARDEIVQIRRLLGHLLLTVGPAVIEETNHVETFITAEILFGVASIDPP